MPISRFCSFCNGEEDGIMTGRSLPYAGHNTLTSLFELELKHRRIKPNKPAVVFSSTELTYAALDHYSNGVALEIQKHMGTSFKVANPDEELMIAVCLPISERMIPLIFSILKLGAAFLPLDPKYPEDLLLAIINKFRPIMVITDDNGPILSKYDAKQFAEYSKVMSVEEIWLDMELPDETEAGQAKANELRKKIELFEPPVPTLPEARPALVVHTTGLTNPKGVRLSHSVILNRIFWEWKEVPPSKNDICALTNPISSVGAFNQIFSAVLQGITLHLFKRNEVQNMSSFIHKIIDFRISRLYFIPGLLDSFLKACEALGKGSPELSHVKTVFCLGDLIPTDLAKKFLNFFGKNAILVNLYGGPEGAGGILYVRFNNEKDLDKKILLDRIIFDKVVDNFVVYILSNYLEIVTKEDAQGEICIAGSIASGYVDMKEEDGDQKFVDNPHDDKNYRKLFRTGEYGRLETRNGKRYLYIEGRLDTQVKIKGYDVVLDEIQELILTNDKVEEAHLMIYHPKRVDQNFLCFVLPKRSVLNSLMASEVKGKLSSKIPEYLAPEIKIIEQVPMVRDKQVCSQALLRLYQDEKPSNFNNWGKVRLTNEKLTACKLLVEGMYKYANIPIDLAVNSLNLSFHSLGGTSLNALSVLMYINRHSCPLTLKEFVKAPSLNDIITAMSQRLTSNSDQNPPPDLTPDLESLKQDYDFVPLSSPFRKEVVSLLSQSYAEKGDLGQYDYIPFSEFQTYFSQVWESFVEQSHSTIITRKRDKRVVGVCLCQDFYTPSIEMTRGKSMHHLLDYTQELKGAVLNSVPHLKNSIFEVCWLGTSSDLGPMENVTILAVLMNENKKLAEKDGFTSLFCATSNQLMRELCLDILHYRLLEDYPARIYEETVGFHPYRCAPLSFTSALCWLVIGDIPSRN